MLYDDSRAAWGARKNANPRRVDPRTRLGISWHYDGGHPLNLAGRPHSECLARTRADQAFHMDTRGWADIGYNALVCQHGRVIEGRGFDLQGAHSPGVNDTHYGVQFMVGGAEAPTPAAWTRAAELAAELATHSGRTMRQWGHRDDPKASTECPGSVIESWAKRLGSGTPATPTQEEDDMFTEQDSQRLERLEQLLTSHESAEADRYRVGSDRYKVETSRYQQLAAQLAVVARNGAEPVATDPVELADALAAAIPEGIAQAVVDELARRVAAAPTQAVAQ